MRMTRKRLLEEHLEFCTVKCKLNSLKVSSGVLKLLKERVVLAHELFKRTTLFLRSFCLDRRLVPEVNLSFVKLCMNRVSLKYSRGKRVKDEGGLGMEMDAFLKNRFSAAYPRPIDARGSSYLRQLIAQQILDSIEVDCKTHFRKRLERYVLHLYGGSDKTARHEASKVTHRALSLDWDGVPESLRDRLRAILPDSPPKSHYYDLRSRPGRYLNCTLQMCMQMESSKSRFNICFMPTRRSNIPCHCKLDTEALSQILIPSKERTEARRVIPERSKYNDWVWGKALDVSRLAKRLAGFKFHHEITTDGVAVSVLFSRPARMADGESRVKKRQRLAESQNMPNCSRVGVDPGRKNLVTLVDQDGRKLRYTSKQRMFESGLARYREIMDREKRKASIHLKEAALSKLKHNTVDPEAYFAYLLAKSRVDDETRAFYLQEKWRSWKFRMYCRRKGSEDSLLNQMEGIFGPSCTLFYGDWSSATQQKGCDPGPNVGMRLLLRKRFPLKEVSEFKTSKVCNTCMAELTRYRKRGGRLSYSRLFCPTCSSKMGRPIFVDRDANAAANILLAGTSPTRPCALSRGSHAVSTASQATGEKSVLETGKHGKSSKLPVAAGRQSSNPSPGGCLKSSLPTVY